MIMKAKKINKLKEIYIIKKWSDTMHGAYDFNGDGHDGHEKTTTMSPAFRRDMFLCALAFSNTFVTSLLFYIYTYIYMYICIFLHMNSHFPKNSYIYLTHVLRFWQSNGNVNVYYVARFFWTDNVLSVKQN